MNPGCSSVILACLSASALGSGSSEIFASVMYTGLSPSEWDEAEKNWMLSSVMFVYLNQVALLLWVFFPRDGAGMPLIGLPRSCLWDT